MGLQTSWQERQGKFVWLAAVPLLLAGITYVSTSLGALLTLFVLTFLSICIFTPIKPAGVMSRPIAIGALVLSFVSCLLFLDNPEATRLAALKKSDPAAYLEEVKSTNQEKWLRELKGLEPDSYLAYLKGSDERKWIIELKEMRPGVYQDNRETIDAREAELAAEKLVREAQIATYKLAQEAKLAAETLAREEQKAAQRLSENLKKIKVLEAKARSIPAAEIYKNLAAYRELSKLDPGNETYIAKIDYYRKKSDERKDYNKECGSDNDIEAYAMSQNPVKARLKAPRSAKFGGYRKSIVNHQPACTYVVRGYVDSQNSYGAMLRSEYQVKLKHSNESWTVLDVVIQ